MADVVSAGDRVFVSGGRSSTDVVVTSATGALVGTLADLPGPTDLLLAGQPGRGFRSSPRDGGLASPA